MPDCLVWAYPSIHIPQKCISHPPNGFYVSYKRYLIMCTTKWILHAYASYFLAYICVCINYVRINICTAKNVLKSLNLRSFMAVFYLSACRQRNTDMHTSLYIYVCLLIKNSLVIVWYWNWYVCIVPMIKSRHSVYNINAIERNIVYFAFEFVFHQNWLPSKNINK